MHQPPPLLLQVLAVFDQGQVVQMGTHEALLADTQGKYYEL